MIKHSVEDLPSIIEPEINLREINSMRKAIMDVGKIFNKNYFQIARAYKSGIEGQSNYKKWLLTKSNEFSGLNAIPQPKTILILGHSYMIYDKLTSMDILNRLYNYGANIITSEVINEDIILDYSKRVKRRIFWTHGRRIIGAGYWAIDKGEVDGIIYLSSFGCGLDSVLEDLIKRKSMENNIPYLALDLDEQTGEAGFNTRIEAFLDMIEWRNSYEDNLSPSR